MDPQQLHDFIIKPTLEYMGCNHDSKEARFLLLCTAAIESDCGYYIKQVGGPALGIWQMEPKTHQDINLNCDALNASSMQKIQCSLYMPYNEASDISGLLNNPMYACCMARLKYSMTPKQLPKLTGVAKEDLKSFYYYYAKHYHGVDSSGKELGKSTYNKWVMKIEKHRILEVEL